MQSLTLSLHGRDSSPAQAALHSILHVAFFGGVPRRYRIIPAIAPQFARHFAYADP